MKKLVCFMFLFFIAFCLNVSKVLADGPEFKIIRQYNPGFEEDNDIIITNGYWKWDNDTLTASNETNYNIYYDGNNKITFNNLVIDRTIETLYSDYEITILGKNIIPRIDPDYSESHEFLFKGTGNINTKLSFRSGSRLTIDGPTIVVNEDGSEFSYVSGISGADVVINSGDLNVYVKANNHASTLKNGSLTYNGGNVKFKIETPGSIFSLADSLIINAIPTSMNNYYWRNIENGDYNYSLPSLSDFNGKYFEINENKVQVKLRITSNMWEVSYDNGDTWGSLGILATGNNGITPKLRITSNMWEASYDNGTTWESLNVKAVGTDGKNGKDGTNGIDGTDGKNGIDGITPKLRITSNMWEASYDNGTTWESLNVKAVGTDGIDGKNTNVLLYIFGTLCIANTALLLFKLRRFN